MTVSSGCINNHTDHTKIRSRNAFGSFFTLVLRYWFAVKTRGGVAEQVAQKKSE